MYFTFNKCRLFFFFFWMILKNVWPTYQYFCLHVYILTRVFLYVTFFFFLLWRIAVFFSSLILDFLTSVFAFAFFVYKKVRKRSVFLILLLLLLDNMLCDWRSSHTHEVPLRGCASRHWWAVARECAEHPYDKDRQHALVFLDCFRCEGVLTKRKMHVYSLFLSLCDVAFFFFFWLPFNSILNTSSSAFATGLNHPIGPLPTQKKKKWRRLDKAQQIVYIFL